jgi:threonine/homoserine/homoserine lactone efflux protein
MSYDFLMLYTMTIFVATIIPGPSMILALTHGGRYGTKRTIASALGNLSITLIQAIISGIGLGAILIASETTFLVIKWAGVIYLLYMGITLWRSPVLVFQPDQKQNTFGKIPLFKMYLQAAFVTAGNPKAVLFFTAIFPQFIDPSGVFIHQFAVLMGIGAVIAFCCFMSYAAFGEKMVSLFSKTSIQRYFNRLLGGTFIGAGVGLAFSRK